MPQALSLVAADLHISSFCWPVHLGRSFCILLIGSHVSRFAHSKSCNRICPTGRSARMPDTLMMLTLLRRRYPGAFAQYIVIVQTSAEMRTFVVSEATLETTTRVNTGITDTITKKTCLAHFYQYIMN